MSMFIWAAVEDAKNFWRSGVVNCSSWVEATVAAA
jgi:hypothetical protein